MATESIKKTERSIFDPYSPINIFLIPLISTAFLEFLLAYFTDAPDWAGIGLGMIYFLIHYFGLRILSLLDKS